MNSNGSQVTPTQTSAATCLAAREPTKMQAFHIPQPLTRKRACVLSSPRLLALEALGGTVVTTRRNQGFAPAILPIKPML